jgi:hypothetical protein
MVSFKVLGRLRTEICNMAYENVNNLKINIVQVKLRTQIYELTTK